jgi:hypothetical protein
VRLRVGDVGKDPREVEGMEVAAAHLDDRAKAAVEGAATGRLDDVNLAAENRVTLQHPRASLRQRELTLPQPADLPIRVVGDTAAGRPPRQAGNRRQARISLHRSQQFAERQLAFAAHDRVHTAVRSGVRFGREARIVAADDHTHRGDPLPDVTDQTHRRPALKRHHRQADDVGRVLLQQPLDSGQDAIVREDQIGDGDAMMRVEIAGQRRQRPVRHPDGDWRHVLERVRHREQ